MEQKPCMEKAKSDLVWSIRKVLTFSADCHYFVIFLRLYKKLQKLFRTESKKFSKKFSQVSI